jgi:hypothetical protein
MYIVLVSANSNKKPFKDNVFTARRLSLGQRRDSHFAFERSISPLATHPRPSFPPPRLSAAELFFLPSLSAHLSPCGRMQTNIDPNTARHRHFSYSIIKEINYQLEGFQLINWSRKMPELYDIMKLN